jgi:hypothetical protein
MPASSVFSPYTCDRCLRAIRAVSVHSPPSRVRRSTFVPVRRYADSATWRKDEDEGQQDNNTVERRQEEGVLKGTEKDEGAMSRRLRDMSEEALESGGRSTQKAVSEAGFSEDLKR